MRDNSRFFFFLESAGPLILQNGTQTIDAISIQEIMKVASLSLVPPSLLGGLHHKEAKEATITGYYPYKYRTLNSSSLLQKRTSDFTFLIFLV